MALSDSMGILATPHAIIERVEENRDIGAILNIVNRQQVELIIAGLPLSADGSIGPQAEKIKSFIDNLCARTQVPLEFRDESLSTVEARRIMRVSRSKKNRQKSHDDDVAAAVILQEYLDEISRQGK